MLGSKTTADYGMGLAPIFFSRTFEKCGRDGRVLIFAIRDDRKNNPTCVQGWTLFAIRKIAETFLKVRPRMDALCSRDQG